LKAILVFVACFFICGSLAQSQVNQVRRILVINELGTSPGVAAINRELVSASENSPYQIELYSESLDTPLFPTLLPKGNFAIGSYTSTARENQLIVALGPSSIKFMAETHETSFLDTPIIICGSPKSPAAASKSLSISNRNI
jgi:hypothetical protein